MVPRWPVRWVIRRPGPRQGWLAGAGECAGRPWPRTYWLARALLSAGMDVALIVDGANVMGSRADGWWRDRAGAMARLHGELAALAAHGLTGPVPGVGAAPEPGSAAEAGGADASAQPGGAGA